VVVLLVLLMIGMISEKLVTKIIFAANAKLLFKLHHLQVDHIVPKDHHMIGMLLEMSDQTLTYAKNAG